jgi:hypothetical protein
MPWSPLPPGEGRVRAAVEKLQKIEPYFPRSNVKPIIMLFALDNNAKI